MGSNGLIKFYCPGPAKSHYQNSKFQFPSLFLYYHVVVVKARIAQHTTEPAFPQNLPWPFGLRTRNFAFPNVFWTHMIHSTSQMICADCAASNGLSDGNVYCPRLHYFLMASLPRKHEFPSNTQIQQTPYTYIYIMQYLKLNCMQNIVQKTKCSFPSKIFSYVTPPVLPILLDAKNLSNRSGFGSQTHFLINTVAGVATFTYPRTEHAPEKIGVHMIKETKVKTDQNKNKTKQNHAYTCSLPFLLQVLLWFDNQSIGASMCACTSKFLLKIS